MEISACAQSVYEGIFWDIIKNIQGNLVLVGGCALNVKANSQLEHCNVYIPSNPGDAGSAIGCVLSRTKKKIDPSPYVGYDIKGEYPIQKIVKTLKENKIVGVAKGRAEFGPRALGNRSLLADPRGKDIKDKVNKIKHKAPMLSLHYVNLHICDLLQLFFDYSFLRFLRLVTSFIPLSLSSSLPKINKRSLVLFI